MTDEVTEAELVEYFNQTEGFSEFDLDHPEPVTIRRKVTISVRFSP